MPIYRYIHFRHFEYSVQVLRAFCESVDPVRRLLGSVREAYDDFTCIIAIATIVPQKPKHKTRNPNFPLPSLLLLRDAGEDRNASPS